MLGSTYYGFTTRSGLQHAAIFSLPRGVRRLGGAVMGAEEAAYTLLTMAILVHAHTCYGAVMGAEEDASTYYG